MNISLFQKNCKEIPNFTQQKHFNFYSYKYHRMAILTLIYLSILTRNFLQHKYNSDDEGLKIYVLFLAPALFLIQWVIDKLIIQKIRIIDFSPIIILYFLIPYVAICEGDSWTFDTLSQSILLIWSINIIFSKSIQIGFIGFLIGLPALIYQGWNQDYQEIIIGVGIFSLFMNWELDRQNKQKESQIKQISQKVENKHLQSQKQLKMIIEVDRNFCSTNQTPNDLKLVYCSCMNRADQYFGNIDPLTYIRNCYISSKKKNSFIQELLNQFEKKNQNPTNFKVRYFKGINAIIINASYTENEELEIIDKNMNQNYQYLNSQKTSNSTYSSQKNNHQNKTLKFTLFISQEFEERQYWKSFQKYQKKLLQSILHKSMNNISKIVNILSPNCKRNKTWTLLETKQIISKLKYITTLMQQDFFNLYDFQKQSYDTNTVEFSIKKIIKETIDIYSDLCQEKQINLIFFDKAPTIKNIKNDEKRILQILMILLENSIASSDQNGNILVKLKCDNITSPYVILEVVDTGKGILSTFQPPFPNPKTLQQAQHNSQNPIQIGLYNLKQILSKIGPPQDLILKSTKDIGTKISFKLYRDLEYKDQVYMGEQQNVNRYSTPVLPSVEDKPFPVRQEKQYRSMIPIQNENQIQEESQQLSDESFYGKNKKCKSVESSPNRQSAYYKKGSHSNQNIHTSLTNINIDDTCSKIKPNNNNSPRKHNTQLSIQLHNSCFSSYSIQERSDQLLTKQVSIQEGQLSPSKTNNSDASPNNHNSEKNKIQKSILKRPKKLKGQLENFINLNKIINNDEFEQQSDLDSDIIAIEIEEFPNHQREQSQPFEFIKRTQKEKRLSHISDISRILSPQNMPSTNAFSNSRIGNETSPKRLITRPLRRNSTLNFSEIEKDF